MYGRLLETEANDLVPHFLKTLIVQTEDGPHFSKYEILNNLRVLKNVARELAGRVHPDTQYLCALAMSGLPIGVAVARELKLPLVFFSRDAWNQDPDIGLHRVLGHIPENSRVTIVDTHIRTGGGSAECYDYLRERFGAEVLQIVTPFDWERRIDSVPGVEYTTLGRAGDYSDLLVEVFDAPSYDIVREKYLTITSPFWEYPSPRPPGQVDHTERKLSKARRLWGSPTSSLKIHPINTSSRQMLRSRVPVDNIGIWDYFKQPELVSRSVADCAKQVSFADFQGIVGLEALGGALGVYVALETNFRGSLCLFRTEFGLLLPRCDEPWRNVVLLQVRLETGRHAVEAVNRVKALGGTVSALITMRTHIGSGPFQLGKLSLGKLAQEGVKVLRMD